MPIVQRNVVIKVQYISNCIVPDQVQNKNLFDADSRIVRGSVTTYGSGSIRTNTSNGPRWNRNYTDPINKSNSVVTKNSTDQPIRSSVMTNKHILEDMAERRRSVDKKLTDKDLIKGIVRNNQKMLKSKYGDDSNESRKFCDHNIFPHTRNIISATKPEEPDTTIFSKEQDQTQKSSASVTKLKTEVQNARREEMFSSPENGSRSFIDSPEKGRSNTISNKASFISNFNPKSPDVTSEQIDNDNK